MKIIFLKSAYSSIGFNTRYTGCFVKMGNTYIECNNGVDMSILLPEKFSTVGNTLTELK